MLARTRVRSLARSLDKSVEISVAPSLLLLLRNLRGNQKCTPNLSLSTIELPAAFGCCFMNSN
jgi:hypothetical protein